MTKAKPVLPSNLCASISARSSAGRAFAQSAKPALSTRWMARAFCPRSATRREAKSVMSGALAGIQFHAKARSFRHAELDSASMNTPCDGDGSAALRLHPRESASRYVVHRSDLGPDRTPLATSKQSRARFYQPVPCDAARLFRDGGDDGRCDRAGKAAQSLEARLEDRPDRARKPDLGGSGDR